MPLDPARTELEPVLRSSAPLTEYAWKFRYPGDPDEPAERGVTERDPLVIWSRLRYWDTIRAHPRFAEIMRGVFDEP